MGKSHNRQLHFDKHIRNQPTAEKYINALYDSPYRMHRRMARLLHDQYRQMRADQQEEAVNENLNREEKEIADTIGVLTGGNQSNG